MVGQNRDPVRDDDAPVELTWPRAAAPGELDYASTVTAPTEWVPYAYTESELSAQTGRAGLSISALVFGLLGLLIAVFGVWGAALSLAAVVLSVMARVTERRAGGLWAYGLVTGLAGLVLAVGWVLIVTQVLTIVPG